MFLKRGVWMAVDLDIILYIAGAIVSVSAAIGIVMRLINQKISTIMENLLTEEEKNIIDNFTVQLDDLDKNLRLMIENDRRRDEAVRILTLKNSAARIFEAHSHYSKRGNITTFALANLEEIFSIYIAQGGNSHARLCMEQLRNLPIVETKLEREVIDEENRELEQMDL